MKSNIRIATLCLLVVFLFLVGASCNKTTNQNATQGKAQQNKAQSASTQSAGIVIDFLKEHNKAKKEFSYPVSDHMSAYDLLKKASEDQHFPLEVSNSSFGVFVQGIDGVIGTKDKFWLYYVNNAQPDVAADKKIISKGDKVEFRFEAAR